MGKTHNICESAILNPAQCKVYKKRWFILVTVMALNVCCSHVWCSYASVSSIAAAYYNVSVSEITIFSFVYFVCSFPGIFALWFTDYVGLNKAVWVGASLNGIGSTVRAVAAFVPIAEDIKYKATLGGQIVAALAPPFLSVPTKVSELWFPPNERSLATCLIAIAGPIGVLLGIGLEPVLVTKPEHIPLVNLSSCVFAVICIILTFGFTSSRPPTPPSESAGDKQAAFRSAFIELLKNKSYLLLVLFEGAANSMGGVLVSLFEEILHPWGYSNKFAGFCVVLMVLFGIVGGAVSGLILNKIKAFVPVAKTCRAIGCCFFPIFAVLVGLPGMEYPIMALSSVLGILSILAHTAALELTIECTFPFVPEALSTGILHIVTQAFSALYFLLMYLFSREVLTDVGTGLDMRISLLVVAGVLVTFGIAFILCYNTEYRRIRRETQSISLLPDTELPQDGFTKLKETNYGTVVI